MKNKLKTNFIEIINEFQEEVLHKLNVEPEIFDKVRIHPIKENDDISGRVSCSINLFTKSLDSMSNSLVGKMDLGVGEPLYFALVKICRDSGAWDGEGLRGREIRTILNSVFSKNGFSEYKVWISLVNHNDNGYEPVFNFFLIKK